MTSENVICIDLQQCIKKLCDNSVRSLYIKHERKITLSSVQKKRLKIRILNSLFNRSEIKKHKNNCTQWQSLSVFLPDVPLTISALQFTMVMQHKKPEAANMLNTLVQDVLSNKNKSINTAVMVLICLSNLETLTNSKLLSNDMLTNVATKSIVSFMAEKQSDQFGTLLQSGDLLSNFRNRCLIKYHYEKYVSNLLSDNDCGPFYKVKHGNMTIANRFKSNGPLLMNITDCPEIFSMPVGIESKSKSIYHDSCNIFFEDDEAYIGYKKPVYDLKVWKKCHNVIKNSIWETIGCSGHTKRMLLYVSEVDSKTYNAIWQYRNQLVVNLANALSKNPNQITNGIGLSSFNVITDEAVLLHHVNLVSVGISSETFSFNKVANMFVPKKKLFLNGITCTSTRALLQKFAEWGTAYWRLFHFSSCRNSEHGFVPRFFGQNEKGVVYQAFLEGIQNYLQSYFKSVLSYNVGIDSLLERYAKFHSIGAQIIFLCRFCQCGDPSKAVSSLNWENFPTDVKLVSYIYEEAVFCTTSSDYMVLLYLLQNCVFPYLKFIKNWMFFGVCWELTTDFFLQINSNYGGRRDRLRWTNYVTPVNSNLENCVPSFLEGVAQSMFVCGKSVELLKLIYPQHFLCTLPFSIPTLTLAFSKSWIQDLSDQWYQFHFDMRKIEVERSLSWLDFIENKKSYDVAQSPETVFQMSEQLLIEKSLKEPSTDESCSSSMDDAESSSNNIQNIFSDINLEKIGDADEALRLNEDRSKGLETLHKDAKSELLAHYQTLYEEIDARMIKANWKKKRLLLNAKRTKFFESSEFHSFFESPTYQEQVDTTTQKKSVEATNEKGSLLFHNNAKEVFQTNFSKINDSKRNDTDIISTEVKTGKKQVAGFNVSQAAYFSENKGSDSVTPDMKSQRKHVSGCNVSHSTVFNQATVDQNSLLNKNASNLNQISEIFDDANTNSTMLHTKTARKQVSGCNISHSTVFNQATVDEDNLSNKNASNLNQISEVFDDANTDSTMLHTKTARKQVSGCNVSHSTVFNQATVDEDNLSNKNASNLNQISEVFDDANTDSTMLHTKTARKQVSGCNVSHSTVFNQATVDEDNLSNKNASNLNQISEVFDDANTDSTMLHTKTARKQVSGCNISHSTVFNQATVDEDNLFNKNASNLNQISEVFDDANTDSTMILTKTARKHVFGCDISQSSVFLKDQNIKTDGSNASNLSPDFNFKSEGSNFTKPSLQSAINEKSSNRLNNTNDKNNSLNKKKAKIGHSSDSTIQNLMYHSSSLQQFNKSNAALAHGVLSSNCVQISLKKSSDFSGVQSYLPVTDNLLSKDDTNLDTSSGIIQSNDIISFFLELPELGTYKEHIDFMRERFSPKRNLQQLYETIDLLFFHSNNLENLFDDAIPCSIEDGDLPSIDLHALPVLLQNCIILPIKRYSSFVNRCAINYYMMNLKLPSHFMTMRRFLLLEDGEFSSSISKSLFDVMHSGCNPKEALKPISLESIVSHALQSSTHHLTAAPNLSINVQFLPVAFSTSDIRIFDCLQLYYHVDWPLNIIVTESCHNKYNQVFSFLLKLKLVSWTLHDIRSRLNNIDPNQSSATDSQLRKLQLYRHEMHNFVKVMQGYVSTQVLHVCWLEFYNDLLGNINELEDLHLRHAEYLNKCVMRCLLTKKAQNVMNVICDILGAILRFHAQLIASFSFSLLHKTYREFSRLSNFLYRVVSKLVQRGYQPHLEDFLTRLNFNGYYKL